MGEHSSRRRPNPPPNWLYYGVVILITTLWATALLVSSLAPKVFQMPPILNTLMPMVLVSVLGTKAIGDGRRNRNDDGDDDE